MGQRTAACANIATSLGCSAARHRRPPRPRLPLPRAHRIAQSRPRIVGVRPTAPHADARIRLMSAPAAPSENLEETDGDITYIRTDKDLPPVAIVDRSPITNRHKVVFGAIALLGAVAWAVIALFRDETVSAVWFVVAAMCTYVIAYRFYARLIE